MSLFHSPFNSPQTLPEQASLLTQELIQKRSSEEPFDYSQSVLNKPQKKRKLDDGLVLPLDTSIVLNPNITLQGWSALHNFIDDFHKQQQDVVAAKDQKIEELAAKIDGMLQSKETGYEPLAQTTTKAQVIKFLATEDQRLDKDEKESGAGTRNLTVQLHDSGEIGLTGTVAETGSFGQDNRQLYEQFKVVAEQVKELTEAYEHEQKLRRDTQEKIHSRIQMCH
jgi:hypothetical protein